MFVTCETCGSVIQRARYGEIVLTKRGPEYDVVDLLSALRLHWCVIKSPLLSHNIVSSLALAAHSHRSHVYQGGLSAPCWVFAGASLPASSGLPTPGRVAQCTVALTLLLLSSWMLVITSCTWSPSGLEHCQYLLSSVLIFLSNFISGFLHGLHL